jgi:hypothetical protein
MDGDVLAAVTLLTSFVSMATALWLAMYLLSRSFSNPLTFRAVAALLSLVLYFFFSISEITSGTDTSAERSLAMLITLIAGHDLTHYMLPPPRRRQLYWVARGIVLLGLLAIVLLFSAPSNPCSPLQTCPSTFTFPWILIDFFKLVILAAYVVNLWLIRSSEPWLRQGGSLAVLTLGASPIFYSIFSTITGLHLPRLGINILMLASLALLVFTVARDQTLLTQRRTPYDLPLTLLTIILISAGYTWFGFQFGLDMTGILLLVMLAVLTHAVYDLVREFLERIFRRQELQLRHELRHLSRNPTPGPAQERLLRRVLAIMVSRLNATGGLIALHKGDGYLVAASLNAIPTGEWLSSEEAVLDRPTTRPLYLFGRPFWLVPAWAGQEQVAVIAIGERRDRIPYNEENLQWVEEIADVIGWLVFQELAAAQETEMSVSGSAQDELGSAADELLSRLAYNPDPQLLKLVEDGFRNLKDYSWLGCSRLPELMGIHADDHIECGKRVQTCLTEAVHKLRPSGSRPPEPLPREWYSYEILHGAYVEEKPTREIIAELYISEGTYYRLRRQALRGFTRALVEAGACSPSLS